MNQANNGISEHSPSIKIGDEQTVPFGRVVRIKNIDGIKDGDRSFAFNEKCYLLHGGTVEAIGIHGENVLVRHLHAVSEDGAKLCPLGAIFFIEIDVFLTMTEEYEQFVRAEKDERDLINRLLSEEKK